MLHLIAVLRLASHHADYFGARVDAVTLYGGSLGYVVIAALALTSTDPAQRSFAYWKPLHRFGSYYLWAAFTLSYANFEAPTPRRITLLLLLLAAPAQRYAAMRRTALPTSPSAA